MVMMIHDERETFTVRKYCTTLVKSRLSGVGIGVCVRNGYIIHIEGCSGACLYFCFIYVTLHRVMIIVSVIDTSL